MQNNTDAKVLTHGYVHGHIHKHKDHTHIHGHIHNHDHDHHNNAGSGEGSSECREFDDLSFCKDILCGDLDDCFFLTCDDSKKENDSGCCSDTKCEELSSQEMKPKIKNDMDCCEITSSVAQHNCQDYCSEDDAPCNGESCTNCQSSDQALMLSKGTSSSPIHQNNLCDLQLSKRPLFENLIKNLNQVDYQNNQTDLNQQDIKKRKLAKEFEIHFPHECHLDLNEQQFEFERQNQLPRQQVQNPNDHHHIHQSCFHTTIPNVDPEISKETDRLMSDYDFYIQFNNFNQLLNNVGTTDTQQYPNAFQPQLPLIQPSQSNIRTQIPPATHQIGRGHQLLSPVIGEKTYSSQIDYLGESPALSLHNNTHESPRFNCKWENCSSKVSDGTFMKHLIDHHIGQEYSINQNSVDPKQTSFHCEWNDCDYIDNDLNSLINHLTVHKGDLYHTSIPPTLSSQLTPTSTDKSPILTPMMGSLSSSSPTMIEEVMAKNESPEVNITSLKIMPKKRKCTVKHPIDPHFTCHWQVGKDENERPIPCHKQHDSEEDLQNHLINDHIGSGKSSYSCDWIGCDRHGGKAFTQRQKVLRHIHIHTNFKPCECPICGSTFAVEAMLKQHLRIHSGEKPFECNICGKKFATSSSLSIHNRVHTGEKPLICKWPGCNKRFSESSNLTKHMKIHMKSFTCEVCGEEFARKPDYTKHLKLHKTLELQMELKIKNERTELVG